ncbi:MAG: hypothetical protein K8R50_08850 [Betaproteobacteria bacterium]|nr:hypothetical protein [Betaproteobacteria bacterium]
MVEQVGHLASGSVEVIATIGATEGPVTARRAGVGHGGQSPIFITQVVGGVHRGYPESRSVPIHRSICIDAAYAKGLGIGQIGVGKPVDIEVGIVNRLAVVDQRGIGGSGR